MMIEWMIIVVVAITITEKVRRHCLCCGGKQLVSCLTVLRVYTTWCVSGEDGLREKLLQNPELDDFTAYVTSVSIDVCSCLCCS